MKITFTGAASTGKTTLVNKLFEEEMFKDYSRMPNIRRELKEYLKELPINNETTFYQQYSTAIMHAYTLIKNDNLLSDVSMITIIAYTYMSDNVSPKDKKKFEKLFVDIAKKEDIIFYTPIEFAIVEDDFRKNDKEYQQEVDRFIIKTLIKNKIKYHKLTGSVDKRISTVKEVLEKYNE